TGAGNCLSDMRHPLRCGLTLLALVLATALPASPAPKTRSARPTAAVQALLDRAAKAPPGKALATLAEAGKRAERAGDRAGLRAAANLAESLGTARFDRGDLPAAKQFQQWARSIQE